MTDTVVVRSDEARMSDRNVAKQIQAIAIGAVLMLASGCGSNQFRSNTVVAAAISGTVMGGQQPISGATIQLYAAGATGDASAATPLIGVPTKTNARGQFNLGAYTCPTPETLIYLTATGGNSGLSKETSNPQIALMTVLGLCSNLMSSTYIGINEQTTVAAAYSLAPYMKSFSSTSSGTADAGLLADAFILAAELADTSNGSTPGRNVPAGQTIPTQKLASLADILATCVNSSGGLAGDSSACGLLFTLTTLVGRAPATDTVGALLNLASSPANNVVPIYLLGPATGPYEPSLTVAPSDWTLNPVSSTPEPVFSPAAGSYTGSVSVTLSDMLSGASIFYTTDGSTPTTSSTLYTGSFPLSSTSIVRAVAVAGGVPSLMVAGSYSVVPASAQPLMFTSQPVSTVLGQVLSPVSVALRSGAANGLVTLTLGNDSTGAALTGTTTATAARGVATFSNLAVTNAGSGYTLKATAGSSSALSQAFSIVLPALGFSLPGQTIASGSTLSGSITLATPAVNALTISLVSSTPASVAMAASSIVVPAGQSSVPFSYSGQALGPSTLTATAVGYSPVSSTVRAVQSITTLRQLAEQRGFLLGAAVDADEFGYFDPLTGSPQYAATLGGQYNMLEGENAMKWIVTEPAQDKYNFEPGDELTTFAQNNKMVVRGHNLCWNVANPTWLTNAATTATPAQMSQFLQNHIINTMTHYKGKVFAWDVLNEAVSDSATGVGTQMKDSIWYNQPGIGLTGTGYVEQAFRWAHAIDPNALLFYNDYDIITPGPKFQAVLNMATDFVSRGVPLHGIGLQVHTDTSGWPSASALAQVIESFTKLGLQVHISEVDVAIPVNVDTTVGTSTAANLAAQASTYRQLLTVCLQNPGCTAFQTWGFTDNYSWVPTNNPGLGAALPFDQSYNPKPAFYSLMGALSTTITP